MKSCSTKTLEPSLTWQGVLVAFLAACPVAPSPVAPWIWGAVVILIVIVMLVQP